MKKHKCPRCGWPGKDPRAVRAGQVCSPTKGFGTRAVWEKAMKTKRQRAAEREAAT
jgi:hypothetical protein